MPDTRIDDPRRVRDRFHPSRWYLGVSGYNTRTGVYITSVAPQSPAQRAGFEPGDKIVTVNGYQVGVVNDRAYYLGEEIHRQSSPRGEVSLLVHNWRNGQLLNVDVILANWEMRQSR